ncbi:hypothetical protein HELRODRAFT_163432 [Helobdella robusta]|uniref:Uncharacterized protein n=1 Tax=Helobdella robusta TaxID=6412 RepID=T1EU15_HELRO|nr:hypothetical protein HELRODRAFT_163432 [Helobdella robusta]ESN96374.1 hypothetical protein HELRODRAFT_163432 [Helobdella robusta]
MSIRIELTGFRSLSNMWRVVLSASQTGDQRGALHTDDQIAVSYTNQTDDQIISSLPNQTDDQLISLRANQTDDQKTMTHANPTDDQKQRVMIVKRLHLKGKMFRQAKCNSNECK